MEGFSYVDIFDTKGIEYLIVIGFLLLVIPVWIVLNKPVKAGILLQRSAEGLAAALHKIPKGLFFEKNHTWAYMERSGAAKIGVDELLLHMTGGVSVDFLKNAGDEVKRGEIVANIVQGDKKLSISSPISGEVKKVNALLEKGEGEINKDPYGKGWVSLIQPADWKSESDRFLLGAEAEKWSGEEISRCKDFLAEAVAEQGMADAYTVLQEGGVIADFPLSGMDSEVWKKFQQEFLD